MQLEGPFPGPGPKDTGFPWGWLERFSPSCPAGVGSLGTESWRGGIWAVNNSIVTRGDARGTWMKERPPPLKSLP